MLQQIQKSKPITNPFTGIFLEPGLENLSSEIEFDRSIYYTSNQNFSISTIEVYKSQLVYGTLDKIPPEENWNKT